MLRITSIVFLFLTSCISLFAKPMIYDCFPFFNELDLLEIRLHEMSPYVDKFVLVESVETFRGNPKPLYFEENKERFAPYLDKIIHVVVEHDETAIPYTRECHQRDHILDGLIDCDPEDIIIISDVDEIIRRSALPAIVRFFEKKRGDIFVAIQNHYTMYMNRYKQQWFGSVITNFQKLRSTTPQLLRQSRILFPQVKNIGWHFSWLGGPEKVVTKLESYSLDYMDTPENKDLQKIQREMLEGDFKRVDHTFPEIVQQKKEYYRQIGLISPTELEP